MDVLKCLLDTAFLVVAVLASGCIIIGGDTAAVEVEECEIDGPPPSSTPTVVVTRPPAPSRRHVWIGGHHVVRSGCWLWVEGHWAKPPHKDAQWMPCHTRRNGETWIWTSGYWI
jgi:hypothetical protein